MSPFVLDASVALSWCFEDESTPATDALLDSLLIGAAVVPALWHWELWNVLAMAERKGRIDPPSTGDFLMKLRALPIETDATVPTELEVQTFAIIRHYGLTSYDAAYLALAEHRRLPLATRDRALAHAARQRGVPLLIEE